MCSTVWSYEFSYWILFAPKKLILIWTPHTLVASLLLLFACIFHSYHRIILYWFIIHSKIQEYMIECSFTSYQNKWKTINYYIFFHVSPLEMYAKSTKLSKINCIFLYCNICFTILDEFYLKNRSFKNSY